MANYPDIPHFDVPFRFTPTGAAVNEQDTDADVVAQVRAVLRYPLGFRDDRPEFGISDQSFRDKQSVIDADDIQAAISMWVPDADALIDAHPDRLDQFLVEAKVIVSGGEGV